MIIFSWLNFLAFSEKFSAQENKIKGIRIKNSILLKEGKLPKMESMQPSIELKFESL